jgi:hypothetical protein
MDHSRNGSRNADCSKLGRSHLLPPGANPMSSEPANAAAGFERDVRAYLKALPALLAQNPGQYALIGHAELVGVHATQEEAMAQGYARFGATGFLVQQISAEELERGRQWLATCPS